jgi:tRNA (guanine37-N1)-methyltransferase
MDFVVLTIFPDMCRPFWEHGMVRRALEGGQITAEAVDIRDFAHDRHKTTDDRPYGGGCGMVMKPEPLAEALGAVKQKRPAARTVMMTPQGRPFDQEMAASFAREEGLVLVCGRYEGIDERFCQTHVDDEVSLGDFVLTGGELGAMMIVDAVTRLLPGVLGGEESAEKDSFSDGLLEHAHYTRPYDFEGETVPDVLLSGNHGEIEKWRHEGALIRTFLKRRDLLLEKRLAPEDIDLLKRWHRDLEHIIHAQSVCDADSPSGGQ